MENPCGCRRLAAVVYRLVIAPKSDGRQYVIDLLGVQDRHLQRIIIFLSAVCDESLDTRVIHRVYDGFHCDVTGEIPVLRITLFRLRHMAENTMQNDV